MKLNLLGAANAPLVSEIIRTLDDMSLINISALCRKLEVKRSTFLSRVAAKGIDETISEAVIEKRRKKLLT